MLNAVAVILALCAQFFLLPPDVEAAASPLGRWVGAHSRVVWVQDQDKGSDTFGRSRELMLYGYDSVDGRGERPLLSEKGNYFKPLFTPDGKKVIVSDRLQRMIYTVDWKSGKKKALTDGVAVAVWQDPEPSGFLRRKKIWVYCFKGMEPENRYGTAQPLYRFPINNPRKKELVWGQTNMAWSSIQLSRDGTLIGGLFPWPHGGTLELKDDQRIFTRYGRGCWTSLSPDNSKLLWIFDGLHRNVQIHDTKSGKEWKVNINGAPGINGFEVYHPRWSNHPLYFTMTGPYEKGEGGNKITGGGEKVEVYIGRFAQDLKSVESWFQLTANNRADFYPEMWVAGGNLFDITEKNESNAASSLQGKDWPLQRENLIFIWENMKAENQLADTSPAGFFQSSLNLHGNALFSRELQFLAAGGWGDFGDAGAIISKNIAETGEMTLVFAATPEKLQTGALFALAGDKNRLQLMQRGTDLSLTVFSDDNVISEVLWPEVFRAKQFLPLAVTLSGDEAELFVGGRSLGKKSFAASLKKNGWQNFTIGDFHNGGRWAGSIEGIAVYNTLLLQDAIAANVQLYDRDRTEPVADAGRIRLRATLDEVTDIPDPEDIGAYNRALVINTYLVDRVISGVYTAEKVLVAEWAVLDRKIIKKYAADPREELLILERFDAHPELEGERQMMDVFEPELDMFYRVDSP